MRNLQVRSVVIRDTWLSSAKYGVQNELSSNEIEAVCLSVEDKVFCASLGGIYELSSQVPRLIEWRKERNGAKIVSFDHLSDEYLLCAVLSSGIVLVVDYENGIIEQHHVVQAEVCSARWAPDYHVLLLASSGMLHFVSRQFDIMNEQSLNSRRAGREELTTVGWGSKETQFQGVSGRKQSRNDDSEQQPTVVGECDKGRVLLAWNGDANYVVVSYVESGTSFRHFCVFDHEGELISYLQQASNVEETVAYRPTGNLIATSRHKGNEREIIFYERNGQRRSKFQHGLHRGTIIDWMGWNINGNIFCVQSTRSETAAQEVDFWCVSNYDWMLKYRILNENGFLLTCWHESNPNLFCYVTRDGRTAFIDFDFIYNFCDEIILSTSGCNVRVTDLKAASIPPPMCHYELTFPHIVCEIAQFSGGAVFLLADRSLFAYKLRERKFKKYAEYDTIDLPKGCICYNLCLSDSDRLTAIVASSCCGLYTFSFKNENRGKSTCLYSSEIPFIWHNYINDGFVLQGIDGKWFSVKKDKDMGSQYLKARKLFEVEPTLRCCRYLSNQDTIFGINKTNDLVMNGRSILKYTGSYTVDQNHLLAITSSRSVASQLQLIKVEDILDGKEINWKISRAVERGAMLIGHEALGARVWLQMPRGNLETIYSRGLLLRNLKELLTGLHFKDAAVIMKKHRIDMNLFYDHDPGFFMRHIGQFVNDVGCAELLNLFVTSLNNDDTTLGIYSKNYDSSNNNKRLNKTVGKEGTKVQNVCTAIREYILSLDDSIITDLYTTVLSTYLKEQPSQVSKALSALREQSLKLPHGSKFENKWIAFVSVLAPQENLFNAALSTYDLDLALAVVHNSQMDPKEYLSLITSFQSQSPLAYQKSKIDLYLGRFQQAVQNLAELDDHWNESAEIIKRQNLYAEALVAYRGKKTYLKTCELCATYLASKRRFEEAALLFRRANNMALAQECYKNAQNWKEVVRCGQILGMERDALNGLLQNIIPHLENKGKFADVAEILSFVDKKYNRTQIVEYYCKADAWDSAMNFAFGDEELVEIVSKRASLRCEQILQNVESWGTLLEQYCCRLEVVRQNKKSSFDAAIRRFTDQDLSISDMFSETSVTGSDVSKISAASTASALRRKHIEKKKKLLKEGSQYEDAALLNAMKDIVSLIDSQQNELVLLLPALIAVDAIEEARTLQTQFQALIKHVHKIIGIAWPTCLPLHAIPGPLREIYRDGNGDVRFAEENIIPSEILLETELMRPQIRSILWQLHICS